MIGFKKFLIEQNKKQQNIDMFKEVLRPLEQSKSKPDEVLKLHRSEKGDPTIGIGHSLQDKEKSRQIFTELFPEKMKNPNWFKNITTGTGSMTRDEVEKLFDRDVRVRADTMYRILPDYEQYSPELQTRLFTMEYRGSLQGSPKTMKLLKAGQFDAASKEYKNSDEYRSSKNRTPHPKDNKVRDRGIALRMDDDAAVISSEVNRLPAGAPGTTIYGPPSPDSEEYIKKLEKVKTEVLPQQVRGSSKQTTRGAKNPSTSQSGPSR
jgi:hypothetical protein